jgi:hypothetical protein
MPQTGEKTRLRRRWPKSCALFGLGQGREETRREKQGAFREKEGLFFSSVKFDALEKEKFNAKRTGIIFSFLYRIKCRRPAANTSQYACSLG